MNEDLTLFQKSIAAYKKAGVSIEVLENIDGIPIVQAKQSKLINGYLLNQKQLVERAKTVFAPQKIHVKPSVFSLDVSEITVKWIKEKQKEHKILDKDLTKQLAVEKSVLTKIFNGKLEMNRTTKAAFYYYFLVFDINRNFRKIREDVNKEY